MSLNLESLQEMWEKDSKIDIDNLHLESLKIPILHAKYHDLYNKTFLLRKKSEQERKEKNLERYKYYTGKSPAEVYVEEPFGYKLRDKETIQKYIEGDTSISDITMKIEYYNVILQYLEGIIKMIENRSYQIKNSLEYMRFQSGIG
jgi:hypothetical protein